VSWQVYDSFGKAGYSLTDYNQKWMTPNGLGEIAVKDTRSFSGGRLHLSAVQFQGTPPAAGQPAEHGCSGRAQADLSATSRR